MTLLMMYKNIVIEILIRLFFFYYFFQHRSIPNVAVETLMSLNNLFIFFLSDLKDKTKFFKLYRQDVEIFVIIYENISSINLFIPTWWEAQALLAFKK